MPARCSASVAAPRSSTLQRQQVGARPLVGAAPQRAAVVPGQRVEGEGAVAERHAGHGPTRRGVGVLEGDGGAEQRGEAAGPGDGVVDQRADEGVLRRRRQDRVRGRGSGRAPPKRGSTGSSKVLHWKKTPPVSRGSLKHISGRGRAAMCTSCCCRCAMVASRSSTCRAIECMPPPKRETNWAAAPSTMGWPISMALSPAQAMPPRRPMPGSVDSLYSSTVSPTRVPRFLTARS